MYASLLVIIGMAQGVAVGGALAAFITILDLVPRLLQLTQNQKYVFVSEIALLSGAMLGSFIYFFTIRVQLGLLPVLLVGFSAGVFIGLVAAALAEVLNVLPVLARRLQLLSHTGKIAAALILGKVMGSLLQWIILER
ncbi:MAG: stage V sporulation protein AB [bacterium]|jgi:stage V sporulation protein AB